MSIGSLRVGIPSPTASALGKFGDIPVKIYTGTPNIEIPLYTVRGRTLEIPIKLRYHASGIKVEEIAGWAGLGWTLDCGGVITRTVRGLPDDAPVGFFYTAQDAEQNFESPSGSYMQHVISEQKDSEPDMFFYNFCGISGKMLITADSENKFRSIPHSNFKIEAIPGYPMTPWGTFAAFEKWIIITEDGTRYVFSELEPHNHITSDSLYKYYISSWYLTEIIAPNSQDKITLEYITGSPALIRHNMHQVEEKFTNYSAAGCTIPPEPNPVQQYEYQPRLLHKIKSQFEEIVFHTELRQDAVSPAGQQQERRLKNIEIFSHSVFGGMKKKEFIFNHGYFNASSPDPHAKRLRLDEIIEKGNGSETLPPYKFDYENTPSLPTRLSKAIDHFGYFNGKTGNNTLIPEMIALEPNGSSYRHFPGANRDTDTQYSHAYMLKKITYPTGGTSEFEYENHSYGKINVMPVSYRKEVQSFSYSAGPCFSPPPPNPFEQPFELVAEAGGNIAVTIIVNWRELLPADGAEPCGSNWYVEITGPNGYQESFGIGTTVRFLPPGTYTLKAANTYNDANTHGSVIWENKIQVKTLPCGGVRIKKKIYNDGLGATYIKKYEYVLPEEADRSSGVLVNEPRYYYYVPEGTSPCIYISRSAMALVSPGMTQGSPVGYAVVKVINGENGEFGSSIHRFTAAEFDPDIIHGGVLPEIWPFGARTSMDWKRGLEEMNEEFDSAGKIIKRRKFTYFRKDENDQGDTIGTKEVKAFSVKRGLSASGGLLTIYYKQYKVISSWHYVQKEEITRYDQNEQSPVINIIDFSHENSKHLQVTKIEETNSDGLNRRTRIKYPADYKNTSGTSSNTMVRSLHLLKEKNIHNAVIEKVVFEQKPGNGYRAISGELTLYKDFDSIRPLPEIKMILRGVDPVSLGMSTSTTSSFTFNNNYIQSERVFAYDVYGRIIDSENALSGRTNYFFGDETNQFSNSVTGYNNVFLTGIRQIVGGQNIDNKYKYEKHGNIKEHIDENGKTWKYDYDPFGRLKEVKGPDNQIKKEISYILTGANFGQNNPNYIETVHKKSSSESVITKTFFDGLGDEIQQLTRFGSQDIIQTAITYDARRRQKRIYKPYQKSGNGSYDQNFHTNSNNFYNAIDTPGSRTQGYPYSETEYTPDALDRVKRQSHPGTVYRMGQGKEIKHEYWTSGGTHIRNRILDENNKITDTYTDKFGNTVETRVDPSGLNIRTLMEYDAIGNLTKVTDPRNLVTTYKYNTMQLLREKFSPDAGTWEYLYDRSGNLRLVKDANHNSTSPNDVNIATGATTVPNHSGTFTLQLPGKVSIGAQVYNGSSYIQVRIKATNETLLYTQNSPTGGGSTSENIILPKGTYIYEGQIFGSGVYGFSITCNNGYEFIYHKYDVHNRLIEVGEYESGSLNNFTQANADNTSFPASNKLISREFSYDTPYTVSGLTTQNVKGKLSRARSYRLGTLAVTGFYSYDDFGRIAWVLYTGLGTGNKRIVYTYDRLGNITKKQYIHIGSTSNNLTTDYEYDTAGRLLRAKTTHSGVSNKTEAEYEYFPTGQPKRLQLGSSPVAQGVDFRYNTRDWLIRINHYSLHPSNDPGGDTNDRFGMNIGYDQNEGISWWLSSTPQYNGNISWVMYNLHGVNFNIYGYPTSRVGYVYKYDKANRLLRADFAAYLYGDWYADNAYNLRDIYYHKNGNITGLKRYGHTGMLKDDLTYTYYNNTNRLRRVQDSISNTDYDDVHPQPANNYVYDTNGNMIQDTIHKVGFIIYDIFNQPVTVYTTDGNEHLYYYDHQGSRVRKRIGGSSDYYINGIDGRTEVITNINGAWATYNLYGLDVIGQIRRSGSTWNRFYFLKDHLGSVRVTVNTSGNVVSYDDYYPFGALMYGRSQDSSSVDGRYKYTGKERDAETKYDYFGARYYDARIGRWLQVDPLAEKYPGWSPFNYSFNNPLRFFDPDGKYAVEAKYGTIVATRSNLEQAGALMTLEAAPKVGFFAMFARAISGDPSIRPAVEQYIIAGVTLKAASTLRFGMRAWKDAPKIARAIGRGSEYSKEALASFTSGMVPTEMAERLKADEAVFAKALEYDIEGLALAVPAALQIKTGKTGAYLHQLEFEYVEDKDFRNGTPTKIMLNPALKEKWKEKGFTKRQIRRKFEKYLTNIRETLIIIILVLGLLSCNSKVGDNSSSITFDSDRIAVFVESKSKDKQISNDYSNIVLLEVNHKKRHYVSKDRYFNFLTAISSNQNYVAFTSNRIGSRTELKIKGVSGPHEVYIWERENNRIKRFAENVENIFPDIMGGSYLDMKWNASNDALYFVNFNNVIFKVPLTEDTLKVLTQIIGEDVKIENISVSGDGKYLLISAIINGWRRLENIKKLILFDIHDSSKRTLYESSYFLTAGAFSYDNQRFLFRDRRNVYEYNIMDRSIREIYIHDDNEDIGIGSPPYYKDDDNIIFLGETDDHVELVKYNIKSSELVNLTKNKLDKGYLDVSVKSNAKDDDITIINTPTRK